MTISSYSPPHVVALEELARRVEADKVLPEALRAAMLEDLASANPASLVAVTRMMSEVK